VPDDFSALPAKMLEIALIVHGSGTEASTRWARLERELSARGLAPLLAEIINTDPDSDLAALRGNATGWKVFDLVDVMSEDLPPISWLVKPLIFRPSVTAWFGKPKTMKSLLALDMCLHIAGGLPWLTLAPGNNGGQDVTQARVVWIDLENGSATFKRRMKAFSIALGLGQVRGQVLAYSMPDPWLDLSDHEHVAGLVSRLKSLGDIGVLVIDHLGLSLGAIDENSPLIAQVMGHIRQVAEECNVAIILIHHAKKGQGKDSGAPEDQLRGHGAILANVDAAYLVERDKVDRTQLKLTPVAVRGPDAPTLGARFAFDQDPNLELVKARFWRMTWQNMTVKAKQLILEILAEGEINQTGIRAQVKERDETMSDKTVRDAIAALEGSKDIVYRTGNKGAKFYTIAEGAVDDET
jgi:hypothetical protein